MKYIAGTLVALIAVWFFWPNDDNAHQIINAPAKGERILCVGDSLVAGVGAKSGQSYPEQLSELIGQPVKRIGKPGYTSVEYAKWMRSNSTPATDMVIVTLGGNDILKRVPWEKTAQALGYIFTTFQQQGAVVIFTGVDGFIHERSPKYRELSKIHGVYYIDDVLESLLDEPDLMADNVHPNDKGYGRIAGIIASHILDNKLAPQ